MPLPGGNLRLPINPIFTHCRRGYGKMEPSLVLEGRKPPGRITFRDYASPINRNSSDIDPGSNRNLIGEVKFGSISAVHIAAAAVEEKRAVNFAALPYRAGTTAECSIV